MKKVACFLFFIGVVLPYGYACLINSALSKSYLIGAAIAAVALGLVTFLAYRKDKTARWEKANKKAEAERIASEKAEEEARIAREKAAHEAVIEQFNASIRQQLADLEAAFQKAQEDEVGVIAALKAL